MAVSAAVDAVEAAACGAAEAMEMRLIDTAKARSARLEKPGTGKIMLREYLAHIIRGARTPGCFESAWARIGERGARLALHAAAAPVLQQAVDVVEREPREVAGNGMLQAGRGDGELQRLGVGGQVLQAVD